MKMKQEEEPVGYLHWEFWCYFKQRTLTRLVWLVYGVDSNRSAPGQVSWTVFIIKIPEFWTNCESYMRMCFTAAQHPLPGMGKPELLRGFLSRASPPSQRRISSQISPLLVKKCFSFPYAYNPKLFLDMWSLLQGWIICRQMLFPRFAACSGA